MSLSIQRLRNVFVAGQDLASPQAMCAEVESSVQKAGLEQLSGTLDEVLDPADPSVWVVRRLRISFTIAEPLRGEGIWARSVAEGIRKLVERGPDGRNTVRFPDRASYWAWFLRDLSSGASAQWWYQPLAGLQQLDLGAACVTLLSRQPELTPQVLSQLDEWGVWEQAASRINDQHAAQLLGWISPSQEPPADRVLEAVVAAWIEAGAEPLHSPRARFVLAVAMLRQFAAESLAQVRGAVELLAQADGSVAGLTVEQRAALAAAANNSPVEADRLAESIAARLDLPVRLMPRRLVQRIVAAIEVRLDPQAAISRTELTEYGGWFLLLPLYISLDVDSLVEEARRPALRWLVGRMCLGPRGAAGPQDDLGLLWSSGLERAPRRDEFPVPDPLRLAQWQTRFDLEPQPASDYFSAQPGVQGWEPVGEAILRKFTARLPGFAAASPAHLEENILAGRTALRFSAGGLDVWVARRPLDILLRLGRFDCETYRLPWRDDATITIHLD